MNKKLGLIFSKHHSDLKIDYTPAMKENTVYPTIRVPAFTEKKQDQNT